jgi:hypothetical protein
LLLLLVAVGCNKRPTSTEEVSAASSLADPAPALLSGSFSSVAKRVTGQARFAYVASTDAYQLILEHVEVDTTDPVHIYLVARDEAPTTGAVQDTEDKYDLGELQNGAPIQVIDLPSAPAPDLRTVVLWGVKYGVNLAQAPLR